MKTQAAILRQAPGKWEIVELDLEEPRQGEVLVKLAASGLCHSDDHVVTGDLPSGTYPICGGHEGAGVVEQVGPNTPGFEVGDHVVFSFLPGCGRCRWCAAGKQNLCDAGARILEGDRVTEPGSFRMHLDGRPVAQMCGVSTFSRYTTASTLSTVKIPRDIPLDKACLVGCGVGTGWGSAVNAGDVQPGDTVVVMGIGGVGINAVQGAAHAGASHVIAVDPVAFKREKALELGATEAYASMEEATESARDHTAGQGADVAVVTVGVTEGTHVAQAFGSIRKAGTVVVTGAGATIGIPVSLVELAMMQKRIQGALFGSSSPSADILKWLRLYQEGSLKLDELVTRTYTLDEVNQGFEDMHAGRNLRGVVIFD
ncbi:NDMA-dependent alcohol dehydrogenase [Amycolatopsis rhizosphaerae]|uniref:NDMA-dependent alcohol dehydrogenase n=1 Tax=Amycolatopsis rhizosphaerae TaxID=2053003 RepID=A0A558CYV7_9PSEU|nr:NDMA-dependent alcohol dehydrogenase [Amycolatopsis rhizosphaerae]TVT53937.1 NDMA-dependent alcohol dehydrogenase [Amycolatopsis rhizosphaerae]